MKICSCTKQQQQKKTTEETKTIKTKKKTAKNKKIMKAGCDIKCTTVLIKINAKLCV